MLGSVESQSDFLRFFDWWGVSLFGVTLLFFMLYTSSRPITGVAALQDWRLLAIAVILLSGFIYWERRHINPFVPLGIFSDQTFSLAAFTGLIRLFAMSGIVFLLPLYLRDIHNLNASATGIMLTAHAGALLATIRMGGLLADKWGSKWQVVSGLMVQAVVMVYFSFLPQSAPIWWIVMGLIFHGLVAGSYMSALDRGAMRGISENQKGMAAGLYSMIRVSGIVFGTALLGVLLRNSLEQLNTTPLAAYQGVFWFIAGITVIGAITGTRLKLT